MTALDLSKVMANKVLFVATAMIKITSTGSKLIKPYSIVFYLQNAINSCRHYFNTSMKKSKER